MILLVCTEARSHLTRPRREAYARIGGRLEALGSDRCELVHYSEADGFDGASAVVISGSDAPWSAHAPDAFDRLGQAVRRTHVPVLGICAGMQLLATFAGGEIAPLGRSAEIGFHELEILAPGDPLFLGVGSLAEVYCRHTYCVTRLPAAFERLASSERCRFQAVRRSGRPVWGVQFHPEASDEAHPAGERILRNFFEAAANTT